MDPQVSILWVNYNSSVFIDTVLESLQAVKDLDYSKYELIIVDNGSTDGSLDTIRSFVERVHLKSKIASLEHNLGFAGGNNVAYACRAPGSKYVVLLNNDAVPRKESLKILVSALEKDEKLGAVQGVILNYDERSIDTAGDYISELFGAYPLFEGKPPESLRIPVYMTSADAAYSLLRVRAAESTNKHGRLFDNYIFGFFDDYMLGLKLWNHGYRVQSLPVITAKHSRGSSYKSTKTLPTYLWARNLTILNEISNSRYRNLIRLLSFRRVCTSALSRFLSLRIKEDSEGLSGLLSKAFADGIRMGKNQRRLGQKIDLYKAPVLLVRPSIAFMSMISPKEADSRLKAEFAQCLFK